jgi:hypothetical protein
MARAAGFERTFSFDSLEALAVNLESILDAPGPVFVAMKIVPEIQNEPIGRRRKWQTRTRQQLVDDLQKALGL